MTIQSTEYLDKIFALLEDIHEGITESFTKVTMAFTLRKDPNEVQGALNIYAETGLSEDLIQLLDFPVYELRKEIIKNLSFFTQPNQEQYYQKLLMDLSYQLGVGRGMVGFHQGELEKYQKKNLKRFRELDYINHYYSDLSRVEYAFGQVLEYVQESDLQKSEDLTGEPISTGAILQWKSDKTDLAELVWALTKSGRIVDKTTGQSITQIALTRHIETVFGISMDVTGLMKGRMKTYKAASDYDTFTNTLFGLVKQRAATD